LNKFTYHEPKSIGDVIDLLDSYGTRAMVIAGGTDLVLKMNERKCEPEHIVSLRSIPGLNEIKYNNGELRIGAMVRHRQINRSKPIRENFSLLADAADNLGSVQIRNLATIGGNICNAAPCADTAGPLMALDAVLLVEGPNGERNISIRNFFLGPNETSLTGSEVLKEIIISNLPQGACSCYLKYTRRKAMDLPLMGVGVVLVPDASGKVCHEARVSLTLCAPVPIRATATEEYLTGKTFNAEVWKEAGTLAVGESTPRTSFRTTAAYRKRIISSLLPRAANEALRRLN
jgi:CO/xanthine dehydrogenase FAD-binding subunit